MQTENLFRFVSVRAAAPVAVSDPDPVPGLWSPPTSGFLGAVKNRMADGTPLTRARQDQADEFLASDEYLARNRAWAPLLAVESRVARLLAAPDADGVTPALERVLADAIGAPVNLAEFVRGRSFAALHDSLWSSFYSVAVRADRSSQELPRLLFWLRFLRLLERIAAGEPAGELLAEADRWRPTLPYALVAAENTDTDPGPGSDPGDPPADRDIDRQGRINAASAALDEIRAAHRHVSTLVREKLAAPPAAPPAGTTRPSATGESEVILRDDEVDGPVRATLARLGLAPSASDPHDLVNRLEQHLAEAFAEVSGLRRIERVASVGTTLVRRRYTLTDTDVEGDAR